jgi:hypothetical protein
MKPRQSKKKAAELTRRLRHSEPPARTSGLAFVSLLAALKPPALEPQPAEHEKQADQSHFVISRSRRTGALAGSGAASACRKETTSSRTRSKITSASALFSGS